MHRRALLRAVGLASVSVAGCESPSGTEKETTAATTTTQSPRETQTRPRTDTQTPTPATVTPAPDDPIAIRLDNDGSAVTVAVTVTDGEETLRDETVELASDESRELDTGIDTTGEYTVTVDVQDGPESTYSWTIESYDVRMGSNAIARIGNPDLPEEIFIVVEE